MKDINTKLQEGLLSGFDDIAAATDDTINIDTINTSLRQRDTTWAHTNDSEFWKWFRTNLKEVVNDARVAHSRFTDSLNCYGTPTPTEKDINYSKTSDGYEFYSTSSFFIGENTKEEMLKFFGNTGVDVIKCKGILIDMKNINKDTAFKKIISYNNGYGANRLYILDARNIDGLNAEVNGSTTPKVIIDSYYPKITIKDSSINFVTGEKSKSKILFNTQTIPDLSQLSSNCNDLGFFDEDIFSSRNNPFESLFDWTYVWEDPKTHKQTKVNSFSAAGRVVNSVRSEFKTRGDKLSRIPSWNQTRRLEVSNGMGKFDPSIPIKLKDDANLGKVFKMNSMPDLEHIVVSDRDHMLVFTKKSDMFETEWDGLPGLPLLYIGDTVDGWSVGFGSDKGKDKQSIFRKW